MLTTTKVQKMFKYLISVSVTLAALLPCEVVVAKANTGQKSHVTPFASSGEDWDNVYNKSQVIPVSMNIEPRQGFSIASGQGCSNYKNLSNADRAQRAMTSARGELCDRNVLTPGWYRFTGDAGDEMASSCVPILRCSTAATGWLNGPLPTANSSLVNSKVCFHWNGDCCALKMDVRVQYCASGGGGFYVYELPSLRHCYLRYCGNATGGMKNPSKCGGDLTNLTGQITSPGYPTYMEPITCHWTIKAPFDGKILLYFEDLTLGHGGCLSNNLTIDADETQTFCFRRDLNPFSILIAKRNVNIYYKSVYWHKKRGFKLRYMMIKGDFDNANLRRHWKINTNVKSEPLVQVSWQKFNDSFLSPDQYVYGLVVVCKPLNQIKRSVHVIAKPNAVTINVNGLTGNTEYNVQVVALVAEGNGISSLIYGSDIVKIATNRGECKNYKVLSSSKRSQDAPAGSLCDQTEISTPAWYRFKGDAGTQIATSCVPKHRCFTESPGWMEGTHPSIQDGVVMRTVCFHRLGECCRWEVTIRVRDCGGFYVYQLFKPPMCKLAYCGSKGEPTPPPSTPSPSSTPPTEISSQPETPFTPKTPSSNEKENSVNITVIGLNVNYWYKSLYTIFKIKVAEAVTLYCKLKHVCEHKRLPSDKVIYTADQVHLLPGFPVQVNPNSPKVAAVIAFYVNFPPGVPSESGDSIYGKILVEIIKSDQTDIETALDKNITDITLFEKEDKQPSVIPKSTSLYIIIGGALAAVVFIVILIFFIRRVMFHNGVIPIGRSEVIGARENQASDVNDVGDIQMNPVSTSGPARMTDVEYVEMEQGNDNVYAHVD